MISMQDNKPIDPSTGEPIPNPKPDPNLPDDWPPKPRGVWGGRKSSKDPHSLPASRTSKLVYERHF
jgi:hypothetical protein